MALTTMPIVDARIPRQSHLEPPGVSVRCRVMGSHPRRLQALVRPWKLPAADFQKCGSLPFRQVERRALVLVQERVSSRIYFEGDFVAQTGYIHSFHEALGLLDRYPWFSLCPLKVHPELMKFCLN